MLLRFQRSGERTIGVRIGGRQVCSTRLERRDKALTKRLPCGRYGAFGTQAGGHGLQGRQRIGYDSERIVNVGITLPLVRRLRKRETACRGRTAAAREGQRVAARIDVERIDRARRRLVRA